MLLLLVKVSQSIIERVLVVLVSRVLLRSAVGIDWNAEGSIMFAMIGGMNG